MDGTESHLLSDPGSLKPPKHTNSTSHSSISVSPTITGSRLRGSRRLSGSHSTYAEALGSSSPNILNSQYSNVTVTPELVAPIPVRHPELQALDMHARNWPTTSSPASSSRAISPVSPWRGTVGLYRNSLAALAESDGTLASAREEAETGAGRRWIRWMHRNNMKGWVVPAALVTGALVRWCISLGSYSGTRIICNTVSCIDHW